MKPSGWPTWRPAPLGYGNMSSTYSFGRPATSSKPSDSSPVGFGVAKVPSLAQRSCQLSSISAARAASYRNLGWSAGVAVSGIAGSR
jgi:hypothetical protein